MQKALTKMNIQLANVISDITGVSGQAIIGAILKGERNPYQLADLKDYRVKASREEVARSLEGNWREDVLFELRQAVNSYHFAHQQMQECDQKLDALPGELPTRILEVPLSRKARRRPRRRRKRRRRRRSHGATNREWTY